MTNFYYLKMGERVQGFVQNNPKGQSSSISGCSQRMNDLNERMKDPRSANRFFDGKDKPIDT